MGFARHAWKVSINHHIFLKCVCPVDLEGIQGTEGVII